MKRKLSKQEPLVSNSSKSGQPEKKKKLNALKDITNVCVSNETISKDHKDLIENLNEHSTPLLVEKANQVDVDSSLGLLDCSKFNFDDLTLPLVVPLDNVPDVSLNDKSSQIFLLQPHEHSAMELDIALFLAQNRLKYNEKNEQTRALIETKESESKFKPEISLNMFCYSDDEYDLNKTYNIKLEPFTTGKLIEKPNFLDQAPDMTDQEFFKLLDCGLNVKFQVPNEFSKKAPAKSIAKDTIKESEEEKRENIESCEDSTDVIEQEDVYSKAQAREAKRKAEMERELEKALEELEEEEEEEEEGEEEEEERDENKENTDNKLEYAINLIYKYYTTDELKHGLFTEFNKKNRSKTRLPLDHSKAIRIKNEIAEKFDLSEEYADILWSNMRPELNKHIARKPSATPKKRRRKAVKK